MASIRMATQLLFVHEKSSCFLLRTGYQIVPQDHILALDYPIAAHGIHHVFGYT